MKKTVTLKDGSKVIIRPMKNKDLKESLAFFQTLPTEDLKYLRRDVNDLKILRERMKEMKSGQAVRIVVLSEEGNIIADGALELERSGWKEHIAELRLIVSREYQKQGLGTLLAKELYLEAARANVEDIVVKIMKPQVAAKKIFKKLGFKEDVEFRDYVRDRDGVKQDLIVMRCDLAALMEQWENYLAESDWQRTR